MEDEKKGRKFDKEFNLKLKRQKLSKNWLHEKSLFSCKLQIKLKRLILQRRRNGLATAQKHLEKSKPIQNILRQLLSMFQKSLEIH